ncbi:hypothetical protein [Gluconobacter cerinus]|uniref:hypothetical protein n=1 Tax=Gluconobacter cerinus TaxID=38307 RepID=UPI001B8D37BF|nr:hypothetical protein [Gluconobacter cerinus]MBS0984328.1 hypothetical protein [Gluconobacter cerinus]
MKPQIRICSNCQKEFVVKYGSNARHCNLLCFLIENTVQTLSVLSTPCWIWNQINDVTLSSEEISKWLGEEFHFNTCHNEHCVNPDHIEFFKTEQELFQRQIQEAANPYQQDWRFIKHENGSLGKSII